jgi:hypothetical protein
MTSTFGRRQHRRRKAGLGVARVLAVTRCEPRCVLAAEERSDGV